MKTARPFEVYRTAFLKFIESGMTPLEASREFDEQEIGKAAMDELELLGRESWEGENSLFGLLCRAGFLEREEKDIAQATELWMAGWTSHPVTPKSQVMSWYWRRPPRREGKPGRLYLSTSQAYNAMKKETNPPAR